ncbi:MAG: Gfo/Idh/MocA family oxidoreductase [Candidatus Thorarchaeota archaeon]|nr:Gfo/Idh/MocA family oxidoreductase [Candidatus Thorarchaeota archaeon]
MVLNLGIIGCGRVTTMFHLKAINSLDHIVVKAVADVDSNRRESVKRKARAEHAYEDYRELLSDPEVDFVAVNTPPQYHEEMSFDSLMYDKHVLCEKPLSQTVTGCERLKAKMEETGLHLLPVHNYAFTPSLLKMKDLYNDDIIGELERVEIVFSNNLSGYRSHTDFRLLKFDGIVEDVLPHVLSVANPFTGASVDVNGISWRCEKYDVCDNLKVNFDTEKGIELDCTLSWTGFLPRFIVKVKGDYGEMGTDLMLGPYSVRLRNEDGVKKFQDRGLGWLFDLIAFKHPSFPNQYRHLIELIEGKTCNPKISIDDEISILKAMAQVSERITG